jgi:hypothetical protein
MTECLERIAVCNVSRIQTAQCNATYIIGDGASSQRESDDLLNWMAEKSGRSVLCRSR